MLRRNILLIDESPALGNACKSILNGQSNYTNIADPRHAVEFLARKQIDIVVLSSSASDADALESLKELKHRFPSAHVILTAHEPTSELIHSAFRSGINDVVRKPIDPSNLLASFCRLSDLSKTIGPTTYGIYHLNRLPLRCGDEEPSGEQQLCARQEVNRKNGLNGKLTGVFSLVRKAFHFSFNGHATKWNSVVLALTNQSVQSANSYSLHSPFLGQVSAVGSLESQAHLELDESAPNGESLDTLKTHFFGHFRVVVNNHVIDNWPSKKAKQLFAYILLNHKRLLCREALMEKFWPHTQPECSRNSLNGALHTIRLTLHRFDPDHEYILFKDDCYYINPEIQLWVDVEEFMKHWQRARTGEARKNVPTIVQELESAKKFYGGDFMEEELYDEWASIERENFREMYLAVLDRLSESYVFSNQCSSAARLCEEILEKDDCREDIHRRLMLCYYRMGCRDKALRQFKKCSEILKAELEVEPTKLTCQLHEEIRNDRLSPSNLKL